MAKNKHNMNVGSTIERSDERIKVTQEVFTPMELVESMVDDIDIELLQDPESTFIDNSAGCGNFLIALKKKLLEYHTEEHILDNMLYAVEMMEPPDFNFVYACLTNNSGNSLTISSILTTLSSVFFSAE